MNFPFLSRRGLAVICVGLASLVGANSLHAADILWNTGGTGNWHQAGNWSGSAVPTNADSVTLRNVVFNGPNTVVVSGGSIAPYGTISIDSQTNHFTTLEIYGFLVGHSGHVGNRGEVKIKGGGWLLTGPLSVGSGAGSFIEITDGGGLVVQGNASIGGGGSGSVTVTNGEWGVQGDITVSSPASAVLNINGGHVSSVNGIVATGGSGSGGGGDGTVNVTAGSWLIESNLTIAGIYSSGTVNISGGLVQVGGNTHVGLDPTYSRGVVYLSASGTNRGTLSTNRVISAGNGYLYERNAFTFDGGILQARSNQSDFITAFRPGDVTIGSGGAFIDSNGYAIGINHALIGSGGLTKLGAGTLTLTNVQSYEGGTVVKSGTLAVTGTVSHLAAETRVGDTNGDNGHLAVSGGSVRGTYGFLGASSGATGSARISEGGSWVNSEALYVGYFGNGSLLIDGGSVSGKYVYISAFDGAGSATVNSGTLTATNTLLVGMGGTASLQIHGGTVTSGQAYIGNGGSGSASVTGGTWNSSSDFLIGNGSLAVSGSGIVNVSGTLLTGISSGASTILLSGSNGARGVLSTTQILKTGGTGSVNFDGGVLKARANHNDFLFLFSPGDVTLAQGGAFIDSNGFSIGITTTLSGSGGLTKMGAGTLSLSGSNSYGGGTVIEGGTLRLDHAHALGTPGSLSVQTGTLDLNGRNVTVTSLSGSGASITSGTTGQVVLTIDQDTDTTYAGAIRDGGGRVRVVKEGSGTLLLSGSHSYTGDTYVKDGALFINGDLSASEIVFVDDRAAFGGTGVVGSVYVADLGVLAPGNSPGLLTIKGDLTMEADSILEMEFTGTGTGQFDQLAVDGIFSATGSILYLEVSYAAVFGDSFQIFTGHLPSFGSFTVETNLGDGLSWDTSLLGTSGIITVVPEPATAGLVALGLIAVFRRRRRCRDGRVERTFG
jgi:autotransporter-associated beta strand protein/T5SS/PEP-CTERM-associated repeat protein